MFGPIKNDCGSRVFIYIWGLVFCHLQPKKIVGNAFLFLILFQLLVATGPH